jgi:hypothetical protein
MALTISIDFAASIARLEEQSKRSADAVRQMADQMDSAASFARTALVSLAGAVSVASFASGIRGAINYADSLNDLQLRAGGTIETLSGLRLVAQLSDTSMESLANGVRKLAGNLVENRAAFMALGITTTDQTEAMIQLGDVFAGMPDPVQRSALAVQLFGKAGEDLIPLLVQGSDGIRGMVDIGREFAGVSTQMAQQAAIFNDSLDILGVRSEGLFLTVGAQLLPVLNEAVVVLSAFGQSGSAAERAGAGLAIVLETIIVLGAEVSYVFNSVGREIGGIVAQFTSMGEAGGIFTKEGRAAWSLVGEEMRADAEAARAAHDAFTKSVLTARERAKEASAGGQGSGSTVDARGQQLLNNLSGASAEMEKLRQKDIDGWVKYAEAVLAQNELIDEAERNRIIKQNEQDVANELTWQQGLAQRLAAIQLAAAGEAEIERGKLIQIQNDLLFAHEQGWLTEESYRQMREQAEIEHQARLGNIVAQGTLARQKFVQSSSKAQMQTVLSDILMTTQGVAASNKELFEINKIAGIANAVVNTYTGVSKTLAAYPYPWNLPMAALHLAAGLAQVKQIKSAKFGDGSSAPSINGGAATPVVNVGSSAQQATAVEAPAIPVFAAARSQVNLTLQGSRFSYQQITEEIIPLINEAAGNGADIRVTTQAA